MPHKPRLLYVVTQGDRGGAQKYVLELATAAAAYDVHVAIGQSVSGDRSLVDQLRDRSITVHELQHLVRNISPLHDFRAVSELAALYRQLQPQLVHLNSSKTSVIGSLARLLALRPLRLIYTVHGWAFREPISYLARTIYFLGEFVTAPLKSAIIFITDSDRRASRFLPLPRQRIVIPNGIPNRSTELLSRTDARQALGVPANAIIIGAIANFYPTKNLLNWIDAIIALKQTHPAVQGVIIGDGPRRSELISHITRRQADQIITLAGARESAFKYLSAFDIYLSSSIKEGLPYTILEAMQARIPVVATRVGGVPEIIQHEHEGLLVQPRDNAAMLAALQRLLTEPVLTHHLTDAAYQKVQANYRLDRSITQTIDYYGVVLEA